MAMTREQIVKQAGERQTLGLMVSYLVALLVAFLVFALV
jgi:hypothetical protein